ncbi:MAG: hypothetical protein L0F96_06785 [Lactococcus lactis]|nr:hypothetical protein [Lactococcus lactis]MDN5475218.1 hypothetical protein [Lactococcus lactis]
MSEHSKQMIAEFNKKTDDKKLLTCKYLNGFVTFNGISKEYIVHVFKWLYSRAVDEVIE